MTLLLLCHSCPPCHGQNILGELFLRLQNPPRSTNNLSTSKSKPWIHFLGLLGQGTKLDSWKQQKRERNLFFYSSEGEKFNDGYTGLKFRCPQDHTPSEDPKKESVPCTSSNLGRLLAFLCLWPQHSSLLSWSQSLLLYTFIFCPSIYIKSPSASLSYRNVWLDLDPTWVWQDNLPSQDPKINHIYRDPFYL